MHPDTVCFKLAWVAEQDCLKPKQNTAKQKCCSDFKGKLVKLNIHRFLVKYYEDRKRKFSIFSSQFPLLGLYFLNINSFLCISIIWTFSDFFSFPSFFSSVNYCKFLPYTEITSESISIFNFFL